MSIKNPAKYFIKSDVQDILIKLTGFNIEKIFQSGFNPKLKNSEIKLLTDAQLEAAKNKAINKAFYLLQMPPFLNPRELIRTQLSNDEKLNPLNLKNTSYVFTDISMNIPNKKRMIVVRESNGLLRKADQKEREKVLQVYFPIEGKPNYMPAMFEPLQLEECLKLKNYMIILNKACLKFEPNDPEFIRVTHRVYEFINENQDYEVLYSTRFYGPMVFYLVWFNKLDNLIAYFLKKSNVDDCLKVIQLSMIVHENESKAKKIINQNTQKLDIIKIFIENDLKNGSSAELALKKIMESKDEKN